MTLLWWMQKPSPLLLLVLVSSSFWTMLRASLEMPCLLFFVLSLCYSFFSFCSVCVCLFLWFPLCFLLCFASLFLWFALFVPPCLCDCVSGSLSLRSLSLSRASLVFLSVRFFLVRVLFPLAVNQRDRGQETWSGFGAISSCKWSREQSWSCRTVNRSGNEIVGRRRGPVLVPFLPVASVSWGRWWTVETAVVLLKWLSSIYPLNFWYLTIGSLISLIKQFQVQLSPQTSNSSNFWPN